MVGNSEYESPRNDNHIIHTEQNDYIDSLGPIIKVRHLSHNRFGKQMATAKHQNKPSSGE